MSERDLLYWNRLTPSNRQMEDVAGVMAVQKNALKTDYMRRWGKEMDVADVLEEVLAGRFKPKAT